jgi:hypothetical protein
MSSDASSTMSTPGLLIDPFRWYPKPPCRVATRCLVRVPEFQAALFLSPSTPFQVEQVLYILYPPTWNLRRGSPGYRSCANRTSCTSHCPDASLPSNPSLAFAQHAGPCEDPELAAPTTELRQDAVAEGAAAFDVHDFAFGGTRARYATLIIRSSDLLISECGVARICH